MLEVPPMAFSIAIAAARFAIGRGMWWLMVLYIRSWGPTENQLWFGQDQRERGRENLPEAQGINIIAVYLPPVLSVAIGTT